MRPIHATALEQFIPGFIVFQNEIGFIIKHCRKIGIALVYNTKIFVLLVFDDDKSLIFSVKSQCINSQPLNGTGYREFGFDEFQPKQRI